MGVCEGEDEKIMAFSLNVFAGESVLTSPLLVPFDSKFVRVDVRVKGAIMVGVACVAEDGEIETKVFGEGEHTFFMRREEIKEVFVQAMGQRAGVGHVSISLAPEDGVNILEKALEKGCAF
ncbi:MAG: hypothetical protein J7J01_01005 [Methanophagales archaeon]|nr:hypothetical protein [Methanophagales archaeon]